MDCQLSGIDTRELWRSSTPVATNPAISQWLFWLVGGGVEVLLGTFWATSPQQPNFQVGENHEIRLTLKAVNLLDGVR